jgi:hypothetical protein
MSDNLTRITLPGQWAFSGLMEWGVKSSEDMIKMTREHSTRLRKAADEIDAAEDASFQIDVVCGTLKQEHVREVQHSKRTKQVADWSE